jgi:prepilin-type N-terminal cleavage/methylation domain-containing protein
MKNIKNNEDGFSLVELLIAAAIMSILTAVLVPTGLYPALEAAQKASLKGDLTTVMMGLQSYNMSNPNSAPTATEFSAIVQEVLSQYYKDSTTQAQNQAFLNSLQYVKVNGYYCVQGTKTFRQNSFTFYYDGLAGEIYVGSCPTTLGYNILPKPVKA